MSSGSKYIWRKLTPKQRSELLEWRKNHSLPWHSPPHKPNFGHLNYLVSSTCYEHAQVIGENSGRMDEFSRILMETAAFETNKALAWTVLPNHYHLLVETENILELLFQLGRMHGRTSFAWNKEDGRQGRKVFYRAVERFMRSERHLFASLNYVHHNAVHHGYVQNWADWPWSSAAQFLETHGREHALRMWKSYPVRNYGEKWDSASL